MSERYSRLFALPSPIYAVGAPVVITAGALLKDNQTGKVLAQLKIQNISDKAIKAAAVKLEPLDTIGEPLGEPVEFQYLDLNMARDMEFGQKTPIVLPDAAARGFRLSVSDVYFVDNSAWASSGAPWEPLPDPVTLEQAFGEKELAKQYRLEHGGDCKIMFHEEKDLWWCPCGAINHKSEPYCHKCRKEVAALAALNMGKLRASRDKRLEAERQQAEAERIAAAARAKRNKKIAMIAAPIAVVAMIAGVLISNSLQKNSAYQDAVALMESGEYDAAVAAFEELGDYKDSAEQMNNVRYTQALALVDEGNYDSAISIFTELGDYKDSAEQIEQIKETQTEDAYQSALALFAEEKYQEAKDAFLALGSYKDSAEQVELVSKNAIPYNEAMKIFLSEEGVLPSELSTVLSILKQVSPDWKDTGMLVEKIPQFIEMVQQVDGVYKKTGREDNTITHGVSYHEGVFEVAGDSWHQKYTWKHIMSDGGRQNIDREQSGSIRCFFALEGGSISFSYEVSGFDFTKVYDDDFAYPLFSWSEDGTLSPLADGWVKQ